MTITGKLFRDRDISLDGQRFDACAFERCRLDYAGGEPPQIANCRFDACTYSFSGAAARTLAFLGGLHRGGFAPIVEETFEAIRAGGVTETPTSRPAPPASTLHPLGLRIPRVIEVPKPKK